jgi:coenzyme F420-reducing hydrogenase gamma subunit
MPASTLPKVAVYKFSSCDGCQLGLLNLEDDLLALVGEVEVAYFLEARSQIVRGPYDVALVEGSITTAEDEERIQAVRQESKFLVSIGACATAGGIQALRNWGDVKEFAKAVYATPDYIHTLDQSTPISSHVPVDFELNGCPINKLQLLEVITQLLVGRVPHVPWHTVCVECKRRGIVCVMVAHGTPCLGPLTETGCGAICPAYNRGCYGCFGPLPAANADSLSNQLLKEGMHRPDLVRLLRGFTGYAEVFRSASDKVEKAA